MPLWLSSPSPDRPQHREAVPLTRLEVSLLGSVEGFEHQPHRLDGAR